mmetsp:Transcript_20296/g.70254  ORF Transcript_20296/g.70254 Transcript_20296/m.70254 type:complete len:273 (+) Transcript_20296:632-1450(+)
MSTRISRLKRTCPTVFAMFLRMSSLSCSLDASHSSTLGTTGWPEANSQANCSVTPRDKQNVIGWSKCNAVLISARHQMRFSARRSGPNATTIPPGSCAMTLSNLSISQRGSPDEKCRDSQAQGFHAVPQMLKCWFTAKMQSQYTMSKACDPARRCSSSIGQVEAMQSCTSSKSSAHASIAALTTVSRNSAPHQWLISLWARCLPPRLLMNELSMKAHCSDVVRGMMTSRTTSHVFMPSRNRPTAGRSQYSDSSCRKVMPRPTSLVVTKLASE